MINESGGIIDDLIVYRLETDKYLFGSRCIKHIKELEMDSV